MGFLKPYYKTKYLHRSSYAYRLGVRVNTVAEILEKRGYEAIGQGSTRIVFRRKSSVVKLPISLYGCRVNIKEAIIYYRDKLDDPANIWAKSWLRHFHIDGLTVPALGMELITPAQSHQIDDKTWSVLYRVCTDGAQVGFDAQGRIKCYDYGANNALPVDLVHKLIARPDGGYRWLKQYVGPKKECLWR